MYGEVKEDSRPVESQPEGQNEDEFVDVPEYVESILDTLLEQLECKVKKDSCRNCFMKCSIVADDDSTMGRCKIVGSNCSTSAIRVW